MSGHNSDETNKDESKTTFFELGITGVLGESISALGWTHPTDIQLGTIPEALAGRDIIGLAETGIAF